MIKWPSDIVSFLHASSHLIREDVWEGDAVYRPNIRTEFAEFPRLGIYGRNYLDTRWLLVGSNPGSTEGISAERILAKYAARDAEHMSLMSAFRDSGVAQDLERLNTFEKDDLKTWALDWAIAGALKRLSLNTEDVVICNVIPFSTKSAPKSSNAAWHNSVKLFFGPLLELLRPKGIVWLGKASVAGARSHLGSNIASVEAIVSRKRNLKMEERFVDLNRILGGK